MKPCGLKECKVISLQILAGLGMDPGPPSSIRVLAESNQRILTIFGCELRRPTTLLRIVIDSLIAPHLILYFNLRPPHFNKWPKKPSFFERHCSWSYSSTQDRSVAPATCDWLAMNNSSNEH